VTPHLPWRCPTLVSTPHVASITARQADVLAGMCLGLTNAAIGRQLNISEESVKQYTSRLYRALNARDRCNAVALAVSGQIIVHVKGDAA